MDRDNGSGLWIGIMNWDIELDIELGLWSGNINFLGLWIGIMNWDYELDYELGLWIGIYNYDIELGYWIGIMNWDYEVGLWLGLCRIMKLDYEFGYIIRILNWDYELGYWIGIYNQDIELGLWIGIYNQDIMSWLNTYRIVCTFSLLLGQALHQCRILLINTFVCCRTIGFMSCLFFPYTKQYWNSFNIKTMLKSLFVAKSW